MPRTRNTDYTKLVNEITKKCNNGDWKLFIIAAEGDKTEFNYFTTLAEREKDKFDSKEFVIRVLDRQDPSASSPQAVYQRLQNFYEKLKSKYEIREYDRFWIVIDTDDYENRKEIIKKIAEDCEKSNNYYLALNNPCFEIWLICHFVDMEAKLSDCLEGCDNHQSLQEYIESVGIKGRPKICKQILNQLHQGRGQLYEILIDRIPQAIPRAKKLGKCSLDPDIYPQKICTSLYQLFENLGYPEIKS